jgi:hypothetical protein
LISSVLKKKDIIHPLSSEGGAWERQTCEARRLKMAVMQVKTIRTLLFVHINRSFYRGRTVAHHLSNRDQPYISMQEKAALVHALKGE